MKRLYTLLLAASLTAASAMATAPVKMMTSAESTPQMQLKHKALTGKVNLNTQPTMRAKAPMKAPSTITDYSSDYTWSNGWLLTGNACNSLSMNVDNAETGEVTITLPIQNFELKGTLDLTAGTLTIPNIQNLGVDSYGDTNYFYLKESDSEGNLNDGATDAEATVGTVNGATITFPAMDIWAVGDPNNEDLGWWVLSFRNVLTVKEPEDPNKDPNEGWTSLGNAKFQDGWILPGFGFDQTNPQYISEVELQQNDENPNVYRLVNPYKGNHPLAQYNTSTATNGYIQFDVTDPDHVTFATVDAGFAFSQAGISEFYCRNQLSYYVCGGYDADFVIEQLGDEIPYTTFKDGVLTLKAVYDEETNTVKTNDAVFGTQANINGGSSWQNEEQEKIDMTTVITFPTTEGGEDPEPGEETWTALEGKGTWSDGFFTETSWGEIAIADSRWDVTIEQSDKTPGRYRILPYATGTTGAELLGHADNDHYFVINATNPQQVWVEGTWTPFETTSYEHVCVENGWNGSLYGTLENGVFSFPANSFYEDYYGDNEWEPSNTKGLFAVALPGVKLANYIFVTSSELCADETGNTEILITAGADIASVKALTVAGFAQAEDFTDKFATEDTEVDLTAESATFKAESGLNTTMFAAYDAEGNVKATSTVFHYNNTTDETFKPVEGKLAKFTDATYSPLMGNIEAEELTCAIEESTVTPGRYRLVEPYAESEDFDDMHSDAHTHYMYIDASNPAYVVLEPSVLSVYVPFYGNMLAMSASVMPEYRGYTPAEISAQNLAGTMTDNTITFPGGSVQVAFTEYEPGSPFMSSKAPAFTIEIVDDPEYDSIKEISADNEAEAVYFNLHGQRIAKPTVPGIYIRNNAKVFVR